MKKYLLILFVFSIATQTTKAQEKKPKVAVVLSGGGAKGIAHIPLLQTLDSLGIIPDLIVGTSMGSVVGGFYAMGYSGDSIASITEKANWNVLLGGKTALQDVSVEEKGEFAKYLVNFNIEKGKLKTTTSLLNDQYLREFFSEYTYPIYNINDFDSLQIPYRAITTDIVNGKEIVLKKGSLAVAMRASMSIPTIFRPVPFEDVLLVDGGILNNFPVDVARNWGADIIIGSDVGGGMKPKEELEGITTVLFQTAMLVSNIKNPESREMCDILIDHVPYLTYSTSDFNSSKDIYNEGKIATNLKMNQLVTLSETLKNYNQAKVVLPLINDTFMLDTVVFKGVSDKNLPLVKSRTAIEPHKNYNVGDLIDGVNRAMGTTLFNQIRTKAIVYDDTLGIEITGHEFSEHQIKASLHFDTYRSIGMILNYTGRNILGNSSRIILTADVAVQPRFRVQYQKLVGPKKSWWWRNELLGELLEQKVYLNGDFADDMKYQYFQFDNTINKNINSMASYVGFGVNYESTFIKPKVDPAINENILLLKKYNLTNFEIALHYNYNKLNTVFFAKKGALFKVKLARSLYNKLDLEYADELQTRINGSISGFTKFSVSYEKRLPLHNIITGIIKANSNFIFEDDLQDDVVSFTNYGFGAKYFLGGNLLNPRESSYAFPGLHEDEINVSQFLKLNLGFQINPINNIYITPHVNYASVGFGTFEDFTKDAFFPDGNWSDQFETSSLFSLGTTASYDSYLGPVNFDVSWINDVNKFRVFFSVGLLLNKSD